MSIRDLIRPTRARRGVPAERGMEHPLTSFQSEVGEFFDRFFRGFDLAALDAPGPLGAGFRPRVDVAETENEVEVSAELPGIAEKDVDVSLAGDVLTIRGERKYEHEETEKDWYRKEQSYGSFHRAIALPAEVDPDKVAASFEKGVLKVTLPKVAGSRSKRIPVQAA